MSVPGCYLVVDAGTSRTRVRLWGHGGVVAEAHAHVGARDVALAGDPRPIAEALRDLIATVRERQDDEPQAVVCSGMITSNVGLVEVPHATAPVALVDLADRVVRHDVPTVTDLPMYFVPGVKTVAAEVGWDSLSGFDVMRGEEAEVVGLLAQLELEPPLVVFHCGSHHKLIELAAQDAASTPGAVDALERTVVARSSTAITGELLAALRESTILASSLADLDGLDLDQAAVAAGVRHARRSGFARAAFLVRVGETIAGLDRTAVTSFLLGALACLDLQFIEHATDVGDDIVVYGGGLFPVIVSDMLNCVRPGRSRIVDRSVSDGASTVGTVRLLELYLSRRERDA